FVSDFDPEGEDIGHSFARSMRDDFGVEKLTPIKVALTIGQVEEMDLPPQMKAKETSSRCQKFVDRHGDDVFRLEALPPQELQRLVGQAMDGVMGVEMLNAEIEAEKRDAAWLDQLRRRIHQSLAGLGDWDKSEFPERQP